jgi:hypothetical protein
MRREGGERREFGREEEGELDKVRKEVDEDGDCRRVSLVAIRVGGRGNIAGKRVTRGAREANEQEDETGGARTAVVLCRKSGEEL